MRPLRDRFGLSQDELARLLGVTQPAVVAWEAGRRTPSPPVADRLEKLRAAAGIPVAEHGEYRGRAVRTPAIPWTSVVDPDARIVLPHRLDWSSPGRIRDLARHDERAAAYGRVLREGSPADVACWVNLDALPAVWRTLGLPPPYALAWERMLRSWGRWREVA